MTNSNIINSGHLDVGDGHKLYWEDWGNPKATPIFHLHGGPGAGFNEGHKLLYNPARNRVIFHDQRGSGQSIPAGELKDNKTQDLISDIEKLREYLQIQTMHVAGGSWGATLALLYAINHPDRVKRMMLWGIFLARQFEIDLITFGYAKYNLPEAWERYINHVPKNQRSSAKGVMQFYFDKICSDNPEEAKRYADEWALWDTSLVFMNYDWQQIQREVLGSRQNIIMGKLTLYYFLNGCFIPENFILDNIKTIQNIPCAAIQGRFDFCTPPISAYDLSKAYGKNLDLKWVISGHIRSEPEMLKALQKEAASTLI